MIIHIQSVLSNYKHIFKYLIRLDLQQTDQDVWYISEDKRDFSRQEDSILCDWLHNFYLRIGILERENVWTLTRLYKTALYIWIDKVLSTLHTKKRSYLSRWNLSECTSSGRFCRIDHRHRVSSEHTVTRAPCKIKNATRFIPPFAPSITWTITFNTHKFKKRHRSVILIWFHFPLYYLQR